MCVWALIWFESEMVSLIQCIVATNSRTSPRVRAPNLVWEYISKTNSEGPFSGREGGGCLRGDLGGGWEELAWQRRVMDLNKILGMIFLQWFQGKKRRKERRLIDCWPCTNHGEQSEPQSRLNPFFPCKQRELEVLLIQNCFFFSRSHKVLCSLL